MEPKSCRILTWVKLWFLIPLPCEINVFTVQDPSKNKTKSLQKKTLQPDPPKILNFQPQGCFWCSLPLPEGTLLEAFSAHVAIQRRPEVKNWGFWGGVWLQSLFWRDFVLYLEGSWGVTRWFRIRGVAKNTISPKSELYHFWAPFWGSSWSQNLSEMKLGLAMGRPG